MSKFTEFYAKLTNDPVMANEFKKAVEEQKISEGTPFSNLTDENFAALILVAKKAGFEFTLDEVKAYFKKTADGQVSENDELSEDELEAVAGGKGALNPLPGRKPYAICILTSR